MTEDFSSCYSGEVTIQYNTIQYNDTLALERKLGLSAAFAGIAAATTVSRWPKLSVENGYKMKGSLKMFCYKFSFGLFFLSDETCSH